MTKVQHSPSPWIEKGSTAYDGAAIYDADGVLVADNVDPRNGPVIAKAPELLSFCKAIESLFTRYLPIGRAQREVEVLTERARDLIALAEPEAPPDEE